MPKYNIWIRVEDNDKWKAIADKPEWLHKRLNSKEAATDLLKEKMDKAKREIVEELTSKNRDI